MAEEVQNIVITRDDSNQSQEQDEAGKYLEAAIEGIRNLTVDEDDIKNRESNCDGDGREFEKVKNFEYPLRPHAQDCVSYLRTGGCKHGSFCKYNHPFGRVFQDDQNHKAGTSEQTSLIECKFYRTPEGCKYGKTCWYSHPKETFESESPEKDTFLEQKGQTECKYHLTSRGCKYGSACRYSHSKQNPYIFMEKSELPPPELNFLGLPIRELEKECPFYMRTGACGYGVKCIYNHPDPSAAGGPKPPSLNGNLLRNLNQVSAPFSSLGTSEATITSMSSDKSMQDGTFPWLDSHSYFAHDMHHHSGSAMEQRKIGVSFSASTMMDGTNATHTYRPYQMNIHEEFPARPGEPECSHFMKTGSCKFKSACRFHHPKIRAPALPSGFSLSSKGLPLRPGRKICWHYGRTGECGHGVLCLFDHPENFASSTSFPF